MFRKILAVVISAVEKPIIRARDKLLNIVVASSDKIASRGVILAKNLVKIVPGIGDMYIILDNGLQMMKAATELGKSGTKAANITTQTFSDAAQNFSKIQKPLNSDFAFLDSSMKDFNQLREKIRNQSKGYNIDESTQNLKKTIQDFGNQASSQINQLRNSLVTDKSKKRMNFSYGGKSKAKSSTKTRSNRMKRKINSTKKHRIDKNKFHKSSTMKIKGGIKSCMKNPGCKLRNLINKTKKKCVKFNLP